MPHRKKILLSDSNEAFSMLLADSLRERGNFHVFDAQSHRGGIPFGRKLCAPEAFYDKGAGRTDTRCTAQ